MKKKILKIEKKSKSIKKSKHKPIIKLLRLKKKKLKIDESDNDE